MFQILRSKTNIVVYKSKWDFEIINKRKYSDTKLQLYEPKFCTKTKLKKNENQLIIYIYIYIYIYMRIHKEFQVFVILEVSESFKV